jgi:hypothetical protein
MFKFYMAAFEIRAEKYSTIRTGAMNVLSGSQITSCQIPERLMPVNVVGPHPANYSREFATPSVSRRLGSVLLLY